MSKTVNDVRAFWNSNPLWSGESQFEPGTREFFDEHRRVYIDDCFGGVFDEGTMPDATHRRRVLDLGCGPGFWTIELATRGCDELVAADLTPAALELCRTRCQLSGVRAEFSEQNAEALTFEDQSFSHVNCQGVIHHTPQTEKCVAEIARVLEPGGSASISVYYRNMALRTWPVWRGLGRILHKVGARMEGRGREDIFAENNPDEIVRLYDGAENPIGKSYTRQGFRDLVEPHLEIERIYFHFFPARSLPMKIPKFLHRILDRKLPFMIYGQLRKPV